MSAPEPILLECSPEMAGDLVAFLDEHLPGGSRAIKPLGISNDAANWVVVITLGLQALPHIQSFLSSRRPKLPTKVKIGEFEIENPTAEDMARLRELYGQIVVKSARANKVMYYDEESFRRWVASAKGPSPFPPDFGSIKDLGRARDNRRFKARRPGTVYDWPRQLRPHREDL